MTNKQRSGGNGFTLFEVIFRNSPEETQQNNKNSLSVLPANIGTGKKATIYFSLFTTRHDVTAKILAQLHFYLCSLYLTQT